MKKLAKDLHILREQYQIVTKSPKDNRVNRKDDGRKET